MVSTEPTPTRTMMSKTPTSGDYANRNHGVSLGFALRTFCSSFSLSVGLGCLSICAGTEPSALQGKLVNISSEMSSDATLSDSFLKQIVAGETIEAERKYERPFSLQNLTHPTPHFNHSISIGKVAPRLVTLPWHQSQVTRHYGPSPRKFLLTTAHSRASPNEATNNLHEKLKYK